jgi:amino acid adenylation domain-containing protein
MLSYQNASLEKGGMTTQWHFCGCQAESLNIHINDRLHEGLFHLDYDYQTELFTQRDIERLHGFLMNLILDVINNPNKKPQELKLLTDSEYQQVVFDFNDTEVELPLDKCVHQLFEEQAQQMPDATAVVFENKEYAYRQINEMANSLAHLLRAKGVGRDDIVAIIANRSYKIIIAMMAVLKAGGAYLPIDPNYPHERITYMLGDADCKIALTLGFDIGDIETIDLDIDLSSRSENLSNINACDDLCYVIYTSGSTGLPKGTMITQRNVVNYCNNNKNNVITRIIRDDMKSIVSTTTIAFDIFVTESLLPLLNGKAVVFANEQQSSTQSELYKLIQKNNADVLQTTPSKMQLLMMNERDNDYLSKLKAIILGGEALDITIVDKLRNYTTAEIYNIYGPTETTVWSTNAFIKPNDDITIGKPIANTQIYILDKHQNPVPIGVAGELCMGVSLNLGGINLPTYVNLVR